MRSNQRLWWIVGLFIFGLLLCCWIFSPIYLADEEMTRHGTLQQIALIEPDKWALVVDEYRKTVGQAIGGLGFIATLLISVLSLAESRRAKITDRFSRALDHLGATRSPDDRAASEVRIGAVAELEGIGEESSREQQMIRSVFVAYIRHYAFDRSAIEDKYDPAVFRMKEVQFMMSVLARWGIPVDAGEELSLAYSDLRNLRIKSGGNFRNLAAMRTMFDYAVLDGVSFRAAKLERASFRGARLYNVDFRDADLRQASFAKAEAASGVWGWSVAKGKFEWGSPASDAKLAGADFSGADLTGASMTRQQYASIKTDSRTKPPALVD